MVWKEEGWSLQMVLLLRFQLRTVVRPPLLRAPVFVKVRCRCGVDGRVEGRGDPVESRVQSLILNQRD